jgi:hypothetical protein
MDPQELEKLLKDYKESAQVQGAFMAFCFMNDSGGFQPKLTNEQLLYAAMRVCDYKPDGSEQIIVPKIPDGNRLNSIEGSDG